MTGSRSSSVTILTGVEVREDCSRVKVFDFFSGCGGASCGFRAAGMDVVFALDRDPDARRTFELNFQRLTSNVRTSERRPCIASAS